MKILKTLILMAALFMGACGTKAADPKVKVITPQEFRTKLANDSSAYLLDVRKPDEFTDGHLEGAHLLNWLDTDNFKHGAKSLDKTKTIYLYCRSGRRSNEAARYLTTQGYNVVDMEGGILAWGKNGYPITTATDQQDND